MKHNLRDPMVVHKRHIYVAIELYLYIICIYIFIYSVYTVFIFYILYVHVTIEPNVTRHLF